MNTEDVHTQVEGEEFIGLLGMACDKYAVISPGFKEKQILGVPTLKAPIYNSFLVGMFCVGNSTGLLVPYFVSELEMQRLRDFLEPLSVRVEKAQDKLTSLGNLIALNDEAAIVSPLFQDTALLEDLFGVNVVVMDLAGHLEVGACLTATNKGFIAHPDCEAILGEIEDVLGVAGATGTVNFGVPFVSSGLIANTNNYLAGKRTSGIELGVIDKALGFLV